MKTVKTILTVSTLIFLTNVVSAQLQFGATLGIGGATQSEIYNIYDNNNIIVAFNAGLIARNEFNSWFALKANLNFAKRGSLFDVNVQGTTFGQKEKLNYLNVPVKAEFLTPVKKSKFFFATGPYLGILLDADREINDIETNINDEFKNTDLGLAFELGIIKPISKMKLILSLNYDMGFTEISEIDGEINNKALTFNVGVLF